MADTVVFVPAWNEQESLPAALDELKAELPDVEVLVVDDGLDGRDGRGRARTRRRGRKLGSAARPRSFPT